MIFVAVQTDSARGEGLLFRRGGCCCDLRVNKSFRINWSSNNSTGKGNDSGHSNSSMHSSDDMVVPDVVPMNIRSRNGNDIVTKKLIAMEAAVVAVALVVM